MIVNKEMLQKVVTVLGHDLTEIKTELAKTNELLKCLIEASRGTQVKQTTGARIVDLRRLAALYEGGYAYNTLRILAANGAFPTIKKSARKTLVDVDEFDAWLRSGRRGSVSDMDNKIKESFNKKLPMSQRIELKRNS